MRFKKIVLIMVLVLCMSSLSAIFANEVECNDGKASYQPMWTDTASIDTFIKETSSGVNAYVFIIPTNDKIVRGKLYLQKYINGYWATVKSWEFTDRGYTEVCKSHNASSGKYRTKVIANIGGEYVKTYSSAKEIN